jgi:hypothetical protein
MTTLVYNSSGVLAPLEYYRYDAINHIIKHKFSERCNYLEIGVLNPTACFDRINADKKTSVDPGLEFASNPASYKMTSDDFFDAVAAHKTEFLPNHKWDIIFIDGLHLADQVDRDIANSMKHISDTGFIVLHDCSPATWECAHSDHEAFLLRPQTWNGTTWKAFYKFRTEYPYFAYTVDTDQGIGIINRGKNAECINHSNPFFEYGKMKKDRKHYLNLISVKEFTDNPEKYL